MTLPKESRSPTATNDNWTRRFWWLLAFVFFARVLLLIFFTANADLAGDEAYYWDWGRRLDWGYYSKPPMIAWTMALIGALTGNSEWGIRLAALLFGTGTLTCLFLLARRLYDSRTAFLACVLVLLTPGNLGLNLFLTIDALLLLFWSIALLLFWRLAENPNRWSQWLIFALVIGLGVLSKQMMLVLPLLILIFCSVSPSDRGLLRNPRFWIASLVGIAFLAPVLWWNSQHQWITLEHTKHHFETKSLELGKSLGRAIEFPLIQALIYTPITFAGMAVALVLGLRRWRTLDRREWFLILFSALPLGVFTLMSFRQQINPNWPAVYYLPAFVLVAAWWTGHLPFPAPDRWRRLAVRVALVITVAAHLLILAVIGPRPEFWHSTTSFVETKINASLAAKLRKVVRRLGEVKGWSQTGQLAGAFLAAAPRPDDTFVLVIGYRYDAAQFAFNIPGQPRIFRWEPSGQVMSQYEVWPGPEVRLGDDALIIMPGNEGVRPLAEVIAKHFAEVTHQGKIRVPFGGEHQRIFDVYLGRTLRSWDVVGAASLPAN